MSAIFTSLSPNVEFSDVLRACVSLFRPWTWKKGKISSRLQDQFAQYHGRNKDQVYLLASGRSALYAALGAAGLEKDDEVLLQGYTCVAVPEVALCFGAKPVYVDCEERGLSMSLKDLEKKITARSKVLIIQHTFGVPAHIDELIAIAQKHKLILIEDCAHSLGARYKGKLCGTFGDMAFFSFGRDKVISSVFGGALMVNSRAYQEKVQDQIKTFTMPKAGWIAQQLFHPIITWKAKFLHGIYVGRVLLKSAKALQLISRAVERGEYRGQKPSFIKYLMPNALAGLALFQFQKLERFNRNRQERYMQYEKTLSHIKHQEKLNFEDEPIWLRFQLQSPKAKAMLQAGKERNIFLGDWYQSPVAPEGVDLASIGYQPGSCPRAEAISKLSLNLPTDIHIREKEAQRIIEFVKGYGD
ncbi:MAG: aminotransferase class I/II-fold pyridoxal phosphate-dependent enzyme [Candidatus Harrisonbacteria bacterium]|nr:aminotransferase class I/II-fold pyridoxal phosphate-dependent enzyme [Candidatus Harrisonbacteria bacterium]